MYLYKCIKIVFSYFHFIPPYEAAAVNNILWFFSMGRNFGGSESLFFFYRPQHNYCNN
jgi:hypothetical protein